MPDPIFAKRRLAELYDPLDPDRSDLEVYAALVDEFGARSVLDVGCGTGTFACMLAKKGLDVVAVDPATASLEVARKKPGADRVKWLKGDATALPPLQVDLAIMTGNVAQVFLTEDEWSATLFGIRSALRPGGRVVFEVRDPSQEAWRAWNREETYERADIAGVGIVNHWGEVTAVTGQLVTFKWTFHFERSGDVMTSDSTLRFRERDEIESSLQTAGLGLLEVRDARIAHISSSSSSPSDLPEGESSTGVDQHPGGGLRLVQRRVSEPGVQLLGGTGDEHVAPNPGQIGMGE